MKHLDRAGHQSRPREASEPDRPPLQDQLDRQRPPTALRHEWRVGASRALKLSAIVLSQADANDRLAAEDKHLRVEESANLETKADVTGRSACRTELKYIIAGRGVVQTRENAGELHSLER